MFVQISTQVNTKTKDITDNLRLKVTVFLSNARDEKI